MNEINFQKDDFVFMRANRDIMSNEDFASYFKCTPWSISKVFTEMECTVDWLEATGEYEVVRALNRFQKAHSWNWSEDLDRCLSSCAQYLHGVERRFGVEVADIQ